MAKIGTAHVEIKPVLNEQALADITERIEEMVTRAFADLGPLVPNEGPLPLGWSIRLPDMEGRTRKFCVAERTAEWRDGEVYTTYELVRHDHFEHP